MLSHFEQYQIVTDRQTDRWRELFSLLVSIDVLSRDKNYKPINIKIQHNTETMKMYPTMHIVMS